MPFKSQSQRRWMFSKYPEMAHRWAGHTPDIKKLPEKVERPDTEETEKSAAQLQRFATRLFSHDKSADFGGGGGGGAGAGQGFMGLRNFSAPMGMGNSGYIRRPAPPPLHNVANIQPPAAVKADVVGAHPPPGMRTPMNVQARGIGIPAAMQKLASPGMPWYRTSVVACVARGMNR